MLCLAWLVLRESLAERKDVVNMKYCRFCASEMEDNDYYCPKCGKPAQDSYPRYFQPVGAEKEPKEKLFCELAYLGFLFWLPLVFCKDEKYAKQSANQGLWAVIIATVCCTAIRIAGAVNTLFSGSTLGFITGSIYSLLFLVFLSFMLFLMWKCLKNVFQIHKGGELESILFFDTAAIIR